MTVDIIIDDMPVYHTVSVPYQASTIGSLQKWLDDQNINYACSGMVINGKTEFYFEDATGAARFKLKFA